MRTNRSTEEQQSTAVAPSALKRARDLAHITARRNDQRNNKKSKQDSITARPSGLTARRRRDEQNRKHTSRHGLTLSSVRCHGLTPWATNRNDVQVPRNVSKRLSRLVIPSEMYTLIGGGRGSMLELRGPSDSTINRPPTTKTIAFRTI